MVKQINEVLDNGYLSQQSKNDLERINNWNKTLQFYLEQINKWCNGGPMSYQTEYRGMMYNLPRCAKACEYMAEYLWDIYEDIQ